MATRKKQKKQWKDLSRAQQIRIVLTGIYQLTMLALTLVDLHRRPAAQINGDKRLWLAAAFIQPFGPIAYFAFGRKRG